MRLRYIHLNMCMHTRSQLHPSPYRDPGFCEDQHKQCAMWAKAGECEKNARFMKVGRTAWGMRAVHALCTAGPCP